MKNIIVRMVFFLFFVLWTINMSAQEEKDNSVLKAYEEKVLEIEKLKETLKMKEAEIEKWKIQSEEWKRKEEDLSRQFKKDTVKLQKEKKSLEKELEKQRNSSSKEILDNLKLKVASLEKDTVDLKKSVQDLEDNVREKERELAITKKELEALAPFRVLQLKESLSQIDKWSQHPFSTWEETKIVKLIADCDTYGKNDKEFIITKEKLQGLYDDFIVYKNAKNLLTVVYNANEISIKRQELDNLISKYDNHPQYDELVQVDEYLRDYDGCVLIFQDLIKRVNNGIKMERENANVGGAKGMLEVIISEQKEDIEAIKLIPFLQQKIEQYLNDLNNNPLNNSSVEQEIMEMVK